MSIFVTWLLPKLQNLVISSLDHHIANFSSIFHKFLINFNEEVRYERAGVKFGDKMLTHSGGWP